MLTMRQRVLALANGLRTEDVELISAILGLDDTDVALTLSDPSHVPADPGSSPLPGAPVVRSFEFAHDTPGLLTGHQVYVPTVGEVLIDAWFEVDAAWDGTSPLAEIGTFVGTRFGLFAFQNNGFPDLTHADDVASAGAGLAISSANASLSEMGAVASVGNSVWQVPAVGAGGAGQQALTDAPSGSAGPPVARSVPATFVAANPLKVVVSQDGTTTGADPGATQGAAKLYLVTATP